MDYFDSVNMGKESVLPLVTAMRLFYSENNLTFEMGKAGHGYASFHTVLNGITYGRITFFKGKLYSINHYKKDGYPFDINDPGEILFLQIAAFFNLGRIIKFDEIQNTIRAAIKFNEAMMEKHQAYRDSHPMPIDPKTGKPKRRKALKGRNIRILITRILFDDGFDYKSIIGREEK